MLTFIEIVEVLTYIYGQKFPSVSVSNFMNNKMVLLS